MMNYESISLKIIESSMMKCTHTMQHDTMLVVFELCYTPIKPNKMLIWPNVFLQSNEPNAIQNNVEQKKDHGYYPQRYIMIFCQ
jgi:hypothetical protein